MFLGMVVAGILFYRWEPLPFIMCSLLIMVFTYLTVVKIQEPEPERLLLPPRAGHLGRDQAGLAVDPPDQGHPAVHGRQLSVGVDSGRAASLHHALFHLHAGGDRAGRRPPAGSGRESPTWSPGWRAATWPTSTAALGSCASVCGSIWAGASSGVFLTDIKWAFIFLPIFGLGGSIVLTLPYAILIRLMPKEHIGQFTGMFSMMRGFANIIAPVVAGGAIDIAATSSRRHGREIRGDLAGVGGDDRHLALLLPGHGQRGGPQRLKPPRPGQAKPEGPYWRPTGRREGGLREAADRSKAAPGSAGGGACRGRPSRGSPARS